jgi:hypothetical protein
MIRQILIQKHSRFSDQELNSILGQIRDSLSMISQTLNNFNSSNFNHPIVRELQTDVEQLKKAVAMMEKKF